MFPPAARLNKHVRTLTLPSISPLSAAIIPWPPTPGGRNWHATRPAFAPFHRPGRLFLNNLHNGSRVGSIPAVATDATRGIGQPQLKRRIGKTRISSKKEEAPSDW